MYKNAIPAEYLSRRGYEIQTMNRMQSESTDQPKADPSELEKLEQELVEARERYLRLAADFDNHRKRTSGELERRAGKQKEALVRDLLPAIDNLERALAAGAGENLKRGVEMTFKQFLETLKRHGFEPRDDLGEPFDGRFHDAIAVGCKRDLPDLAVIEVWERGWMRGTELFRPAKVLVNKLEPENATSQSRAASRAQDALLAKN